MLDDTQIVKIVALRDQALKQRDQMLANANALAGAVDAYNHLLATKLEEPEPPKDE